MGLSPLSDRHAAAPPRAVADWATSGLGFNSLNGQRRQDRLDLAGEVRLGEAAMLVGPLLPIPDPQAVLGQPGENLADAGRLLLDHSVSAAADGGELFVGQSCPKRSRRRTLAARRCMSHATRTRKNSSRFEPTMARNFSRSRSGKSAIEPFLQHAMVELQPTQFAVDEQVRRFQGVLWHGAMRDRRHSSLERKLRRTRSGSAEDGSIVAPTQRHATSPARIMRMRDTAACRLRAQLDPRRRSTRGRRECRYDSPATVTSKLSHMAAILLST